MEHQKCYVFEPPKPKGNKKRKWQGSEETSWISRRRVFQRLWTRQNARIQNVLREANEATLSKVTDFVERSRSQESAKLPAGLITAGPNVASHSALFNQLGSRLKELGSTAYVVLSASECSNLKSLLKTLIARATTAPNGEQNENAVNPRSGKGPRPLNYDLQLLQDHANAKALKSVVVVFQDTEAFDNHVLSDAIDLLHLWRTRVPFMLFFGVATSTDALQDRLSRTALRSLQGEEFDVVQADDLLERVFLTAVDGEESRIWLGPGVTGMIFDRQKDHVQSALDLVDTLKYAYMSHFYANRGSMWAGQSDEDDDGEWEYRSTATDEDREVLRLLPSFQNEITSILEYRGGHKDSVHEVDLYMSSDSTLDNLVKEKVREANVTLRNLVETVRIVHIIATRTAKAETPPLSALYARAMGGRLLGSPLLREFMLFIKRLDSATFLTILQDIQATFKEPPTWFESTLTALERLIEHTSAEGPLRSEHDDRNTTVRTTIIAKKAQLSKEKSTLSKGDEEYSKQLASFVETLEDHFGETLVDPSTMCFHEVFMYDVKGTHRATFAPKTRAAIERALSAPHDYLACDCCGKGNESALSSSQPSSAILYQLYLESGSLINVSDLYSAYAAIMGDQMEDDDSIKALFQRGLAELKYLGMIRPSRKKTDHIAKVAWQGL